MKKQNRYTKKSSHFLIISPRYVPILNKFHINMKGQNIMSNDIILYNTEDGQTKVELRLQNGTVWLSQLELAELFDTTKNNISLHIKNIFEDKELDKEVTVKDYLTVQKEGDRDVQRKIMLYNLDIIVAIVCHV